MIRIRGYGKNSDCPIYIDPKAVVAVWKEQGEWFFFVAGADPSEESFCVNEQDAYAILRAKDAPIYPADFPTLPLEAL